MAAETYGVLEAVLPEASAEMWDLWCSELGASGSEWLEPAPPLPDAAPPAPVQAAPPGTVRVRHFFTTPPGAAAATPPAGTPDAWLTGFRARFADLAPPLAVTWSVKPVEPWATQWRRHFAPLPVGERFLICPPWDDGGSSLDGASVPADAEGRLRIVIDPGQGFGTGRHASTALALQLIEQALRGRTPGGAPRGRLGSPASPRSGHTPPGGAARAAGTEPRFDRMLDIGTGSGILLIAARLLCVREGWAVDIDERVGPELKRNLALSGLGADVHFQVGTPADVPGDFPLVVANITAPVLTEYAADLRRLTSPGGHLILSGLLAAEVEPVLAAIAGPPRKARAGWERVSRAGADGWVAVWLTRGEA